ncbi:MAG TPA: malto-oligosyltrehalose synthase [Bryobacteraceae bacterium]|nr:malto-oligosyltrehalose synthase [Bryobacteraceae bacterium]
MQRKKTRPSHVPSATYRVQLNHLFTFEMARDIVAYLDDLGISDLYASPFLMARPGSLHGYDVTDHSRLNPEIGGQDAFLRLSAELQRHRMGLVVDVVPNHMCISHPSNTWWWDVLENGPSSTFAHYFDIDWHPPKEELTNKVLLPILGDQYGRVLENQEIQVACNEGQFFVTIYGQPLPLGPRSWTTILEPALAKLRDKFAPDDLHLAELESIVTALNHLPTQTETDEAKIRERQREKEIVKRRLSELMSSSAGVNDAIRSALVELNGQRGVPRSFDRLERLLESQAYRVSYWRVAMDEINYRRFFDVNDLAAIRPEDPEVFSAIHALIFDLVRRGNVTGLRIDHPDGLFEPERYFRSLQEACSAQSVAAGQNSQEQNFYIVAEKILMKNESLRASWAIEGTTGYDFLNVLNGVFVDRSKEKAFHLLYRRFAGWSEDFNDLVSDSKRLILQVAMSSELNVLSRRLDRISEQHRWSRDFTLENLRDALREVLATFPVYRTYARSDDTQMEPEDRRHVIAAIREGRRRNPAISGSVFEFIQSVLLLEHPDGLDEQQRAERHNFVMRFQQLTAPVTAKGLEDTAFYRYYPLVSLNEVGGNPDRFGISVPAFHRRNIARQELWPHSMSATSTHDTKRAEDVRARINALSEIPREWHLAIRRWTDMNRRWKIKIDGAAAPDHNEEYLIYQTLVGTWPLAAMTPEEHGNYVKRIQAYMQKALHEAKIYSSWVNPNTEHDKAVDDFVRDILDDSRNSAFLDDFRQFQIPIARAGMWNSLSQVLLKIASPGVPDFYQGSEIWSFHLVDPDNRQPVDFEMRKRLAAKLRADAEADPAPLVCRLMNQPCDGAIKMYVTRRALCFRRKHFDLFAEGAYVPLSVRGARAKHVVAFARTTGNRTVLALAARFFVRLCASHPLPCGEEVWGNTTLLLPRRIAASRFRDVIAGSVIEAQSQDDYSTLPLAEIFARCPVALLAGEDAA